MMWGGKFYHFWVLKIYFVNYLEHTQEFTIFFMFFVSNILNNPENLNSI